MRFPHSLPRLALLSLPLAAIALFLLAAAPSVHAQGTNSDTIYQSYDGELDLTDSSDYSTPINPQNAYTTDVLLWGPYTSGSTFTAEGETLNFGTLDQANTSSALVLTDGTISLNSASNSLATPSDILYTSTAGMTLDIGIIANTSGNFDTVGTTTMNGLLSGSGNITITGGGTFILAGADTESGIITAGPGTLVLDGTAALGTATLGLANGGTVDLLSNTSATYSTKAVTIANTGSYTLDLDPLTSASNQTITLSGGLTAAANLTGTLNVISHNGYSLALGAVSLPSSTGGPYSFTFNPSVPLSISSISAGAFGSTLNFMGGNTITVNGMSSAGNGDLNLNLSGSATTLVLSGTTNLANSNNFETFNWTLSGGTLDINNSGALGFHNNGWQVPIIYLAGGNFDNTSGTAITINNGSGSPANIWYADSDFTFGGSSALNIGVGAFYLSGTDAGVVTRTITVNGANALTIGGVVSSSGASGGVGLTKAGPGPLILAGADTYTGATAVNAGTLQIGNGTGGSINSSSGLTVAGGATVAFDEATGSTYSVAISDGGTVSGTEGSGITNTLGGVISGAGGFIQSGAGETILAAGNSYTGATTVNAGTLQIGNGTGGSINSSGSLTVAGGATVAFDEATGSTYSLAISGSGTVSGAEGSGITNTLSGVISGTGGFTQAGAGVTILSASNTYSGATAVNAGTLQIGNGTGGSINASGSLTVAGGATVAFDEATGSTYSLAISDGGTVSGLEGSGITNTLSGLISGTGGFTQSGAGETILTNASSTFTGNVIIGSGTTALNASMGGAVNPAHGALGNSQNAHTITVNSGGTLVFLTSDELGTAQSSPVVSIVDSGIIMSGSGSSAGTAAAGALTTLGAITLNGGTITANGGLNFSSQDTGAFNLNGTVTVTGATPSVMNTTSAAFGQFLLGTGGSTTFNVSDVTGDSGADLTVSAILANPWQGSATAGIIKTGPGTMVLSNTNIYTGSTTVNMGTLSLTGSMSPSSTLVVGGGAFSFAPAIASRTQTVNGLTVNLGASTVDAVGASTLNLGAISRTAGNGGVVNFNDVTSGTVTTTTANINGILGPWAYTGTGTGLSYAANNGSNQIVAYTGATAATASNMAGATNSTNFSYSSGGTLTLTGGPSSANTFQSTGGATTLDNGGTNLTLAGLMDAGTGALTVQDTGMLVAGTNKDLDVVSNGQSITISSVVADNSAGASILTFSGPGAGTLTLTASNTYTGGTVVGNGTLQVGNGTSGFISNTGASTVGVGATLAFDEPTGGTYSAGITDNGTVAGAEGSGITDTLSGLITGTGGFTQSGAGETILTNASSTFTGSVTISSGTTALNASMGGAFNPTHGPLGNSQAVHTITVNSGGTLLFLASDELGNATTDPVVSIVDSGTMISQGVLTTLPAVTLNGGTITANGGLNGGGVTIGSIDLNGTVTVVGSTPSVLNATAAANSQYLLNSTNGGVTTFNVGSTGNAVDLTLSGVVNNPWNGLIGSIVKTGAGTMELTAQNGYSGATTVNAGVLEAINTGGSASKTSFGSSAMTVNTGGTLLTSSTATTSSNYTFTNALTLNGGTISSELSNTFWAGLTTIGSAGGTLSDSGDGSNTGTWRFLFMDGSLLGTGNLSVTNSGLYSGPTSQSIVDFGNGGTASVNTYTGTISVTPDTGHDGTYLEIDGQYALANATVNLTGNNGQVGDYGTPTLIFYRGGSAGSVSIGGLSGSGSFILQQVTFAANPSGASIALTVGGGSTNPTTTYSGDMSGSGSLTKAGTGTLTLSGSNTYSGSTTVSAGTLLVSGSLSGSTAVSVATGGILEVDGSVNNAVSIGVNDSGLQGNGKIGGASLVGSTLSPGLDTNLSTTGVLTSSSSVSLDNNSTFAIRLGVSVSGSDSDSLALASGTATLGNAVLQLTLGGNIANARVGTMYDIITGVSANDISGKFAQGSTITSGGWTFEILYDENAAGTGSGDDVVLDLTAVPEAQTWGMIVFGFGMLLCIPKLRKRRVGA